MALLSPDEILKKVQGGSTAPIFSTPLQTLSTPTQSSLPSPQSILDKSRPAGGSFFGNLASSAGAFIKKAVPAIGGFFKEQATNVKDVFTGDLAATPDDYLEGIKQTGSGIVKIAQGINEGVARIGKSALEATIGEENTRKIAESPIGDFAKVATGRQNFIDAPGLPQPSEAGKPLDSYQVIFKKAEDYALNNDASIDQAKGFAGLIVIGSIFMDNPAFGPGKGAAFKLSEEALERVAKETTEDGIKAILKAENPALRDVELDALTPVFRDASTPDEVRAAYDQIARVQRSAAENVAKEAPDPDTVLARARENLTVPTRAVDEAPAPRETFYRALDDGQNGVRFEPVDGQPVRIADEIETFVHQPENGAYEVLEASTGRIIGRAAETPEAAIQSAREAIQGKKLDEILAKIQENTPVPGPREAIRRAPGSPQDARIAERGLTPTAAPRPFNPDLIRAISAEDTPGPIIDRLRGEFPTLSDNALAPIAKRLSKLKRTGDIEGILQVIRNIDADISRARKRAGTRQGPVRISKETLDQSIAKVGKKEAVEDLPPSIGQLLTDSEKLRYVDTVERAIRNKEDAVLAQQEYDALFEYADQRIIDRFEELKIQRDIMRDVLDSSPGRDLNNLYRGTFLSPDDVGLDELVARGRPKGADSRIGEIMMGQVQPGVADTVAQGQKALDDWRAMRKELAEIEKEMREIAPAVKAARTLQTMIEDVPVIARKDAGEIETLADPEDIRKKYKDISGFMGQARDLYRNFEHVFGENFPQVKKIILDPFDKSKGEMVDLLKSIGDDLEKNVIKKLGINKGSKLSAAVQRYGDTSLPEGQRWTFDKLVNEVGSENAGKVIEADAFFRSRYNTFIDRVNAVRAEIFPNDPSKLIPKRKDYYRHFQELGDGFRAIVDLFESPAGIDPQLAGISEWTKPKAKFLSFAQERLGKDSTIDAVGGFLNYAPSYAYAVHIDPHIGKFRYLRRRLAEVSPTPGVRELTDAANPEAAAMGAKDLVKQDGINNFLEYLDDFGNDLAGKTNPFDRWMQKVVPGGRKTFRAINYINQRVKANTILVNLSSSIAQIFNVPNGVASAKLYSIPGAQKTIASIFLPNDAMAKSAFIKERFREDLAQRFKVDWIDHPIRGSSERAKEIAVWITQALDEVGTKFIWNSHYAKAIAEGAEDPIKYADDITRKMVAGRGVGEVPLLQKSKIFQLVAPFQIEVGNAWFVLGDFVKRKDFGAVATVLIANYLMNRAAEEVRGSPVVFDPINSLIDGATQAADEMDEGNYDRAAYKFVGRQVGEILSNVPLGQTAAAAVKDDWVKGIGFEGGKKELFGAGDPGRFGGGVLAINGLADPLYKLLPPFGGMQVKRTLEGVQSMIQGQVKDKNDKLSFTATPSFRNVVQAFLFGKNSTGEAQEFYDSRSDLFQRIYRQDSSRTETRLEAERVWAEVKDLPRDEAIAKLQALEQSDPTLADAVGDVAESDALGLTGTERLIKMLGVENGERAKYIADTVGDLKTREEQIQYLQNLDNKELISDDVFAQLEVLLPGKIKAE